MKATSKAWLLLYASVVNYKKQVKNVYSLEFYILRLSENKSDFISDEEPL